MIKYPILWKYDGLSTLYTFPDKEPLIPLLNNSTIVPLLSTIVDIPSEVPLKIHLFDSKALSEDADMDHMNFQTMYRC